MVFKHFSLNSLERLANEINQLITAWQTHKFIGHHQRHHLLKDKFSAGNWAIIFPLSSSPQNQGIRDHLICAVQRIPENGNFSSEYGKIEQVEDNKSFSHTKSLFFCRLASLDPSACSQETKNVLYQKAKEAFSDQHHLPAYYELILPYLGM